LWNHKTWIISKDGFENNFRRFGVVRNLPAADVAKVRSTIKKKTQADAYKKMIHDGIRGVSAAGARRDAFNKAVYEGVQKVTAGLKNKERGAFRRDITGERMAASAKSSMKRRAAKQSLSMPDM